MRRKIKYSLALWSVLVLVGCSPVARVPMQKFILAPQRYVTNNARSRTRKILLINDMTANEAYSSNKMVYLKAPFALRAFANHEWIAPPAQMLQSLIGNALIARNYFKAVVFAPFVGVSDYILSTRLLSLQQEFLAPLSEEHLAIRVIIIKESTSQVVAEQVFQSTLPVPANNPYSGVIVANKMSDDMSNAIAQFVIRSV